MELQLVQVQLEIIGAALFEPHEIGSGEIGQILRNDGVEGNIEF